MFTMELRHLRYFVAVAEASNFTKAAAHLRVAQPAVSRQVQALEDELGVDLLRRSPRRVTLTAEGELFLEEVRDLLKRAEASVAKVRALARGEYGKLHIGYEPSPTVDLLPAALARFQIATPHVKVVLHDLAGDELCTGLLEGPLQLAVMVQPTGGSAAGLAFEELCRYPFVVAIAPGHPFARLKSVSVEQVASEPLVAFGRREYSEFHRMLDRMFAPHHLRPCIAVECDSASSLITEVAVGRGVALVSESFKRLAGRRLVYRPLSDATEVHRIGIVRATQGDVTPAGEKFCEALRTVFRTRPAKKSQLPSTAGRNVRR
jgi:DNA-binding transcriptional LysR family regulator